MIMESKTYDALRAGEQSWWYLARTRVAERVMQFVRPPTGEVLDVGAGFGGMLPWLKQYGSVDAMELYPAAVEVCKQRGYRNVYTSWEYFKSDAPIYGFIAAFDVLEHIEDDGEALRVLREHLAPNGILLINVPAYPSLWSEHDVRHAHIRRYTKDGLMQVLRKEGFRVCYCGHWNAVLFPVFILSRLLYRGGEEQLQPSRLVAWICALLLRWEARFIPAWRLPFGSSLVACVVRE